MNSSSISLTPCSVLEFSENALDEAPSLLSLSSKSSSTTFEGTPVTYVGEQQQKTLSSSQEPIFSTHQAGVQQSQIDDVPSLEKVTKEIRELTQQQIGCHTLVNSVESSRRTEAMDELNEVAKKLDESIDLLKKCLQAINEGNSKDASKLFRYGNTLKKLAHDQKIKALQEDAYSFSEIYQEYFLEALRIGRDQQGKNFQQAAAHMQSVQEHLKRMEILRAQKNETQAQTCEQAAEEALQQALIYFSKTNYHLVESLE